MQKKVVSPVSCIKCESTYHPSCAYQAKVFTKDDILNCCDIKKSEVIRSEIEKETNLISIKVIENTMEGLLQRYLTGISNEMEELKKSVEFMSHKFEEQRVISESALREVKELKTENMELKNRIEKLEMKIQDNEQEEKKFNITMMGIPEQKGSTEEIVQSVFEGMNLQIEKEDVLECFRVSKKENAPIVIKFKKIETKKIVFKKLKSIKSIKLDECQLEGGNRPIYINDDLTRENQELYKKARKIKKEKNYKAIYCTDGKLFLRKQENSNPIRIKREEDLY